MDLIPADIQIVLLLSLCSSVIFTIYFALVLIESKNKVKNWWFYSAVVGGCIPPIIYIIYYILNWMGFALSAIVIILLMIIASRIKYNPFMKY